MAEEIACGEIFNVQDLYGIPEPAGCIAEESSRERSVELDPVRGRQGQIARVCPRPYGIRTASIKGRGDLPHATLSAGCYGPGEAFVSSQARREKNTGEPEFEISTEGYFNRGEENAFESTPDPAPAPSPAA